jgi:catalase
VLSLGALPRLAAAGVIVAGVAAGFAAAAGWLTPGKLTPNALIDALEANAGGPYPGFRRNHAKGVCIIGVFEGNGAGTPYSAATVFTRARTPVLGRLALAGGVPALPDGPTAVRSMALSFRPAGGEEWRTGMNDIPVFVVKDVRGFQDLTIATTPDPATGKPDPAKLRALVAAHPEFPAALKLLGAKPFSTGFANAAYNSLNAFRFINAEGAATPVRWAMVPVTPYAPEAPDQAASADKNYLFDDLNTALQHAPLQWHLVVTIGAAGDPTSDSTLPWPEDRPHIDLGTLTIDRAETEAAGNCRDINYDPLVLPSGIAASDDPLLSARSAAYSQSFTRREGETKTPSAVQLPTSGKGG